MRAAVVAFLLLVGACQSQPPAMMPMNRFGWIFVHSDGTVDLAFYADPYATDPHSPQIGCTDLGEAGSTARTTPQLDAGEITIDDGTNKLRLRFDGSAYRVEDDTVALSLLPGASLSVQAAGAAVPPFQATIDVVHPVRVDLKNPPSGTWYVAKGQALPIVWSSGESGELQLTLAESSLQQPQANVQLGSCSFPLSSDSAIIPAWAAMPDYLDISATPTSIVRFTSGGYAISAGVLALSMSTTIGIE